MDPTATSPSCNADALAMTIGWLALAILAGLMLVGRRHHLPRRLAIVTEIE